MPDRPIPLPGLEHLISVLEAHGGPVVLHPPVPTAPRAGEFVLGEPFDPLLAAVYSRFDGGRLGDLLLFRTAEPERDLVAFNSAIRRGEEARIQKLLQYGGREGFAYHLSTVPSLADSHGVQPVVYFSNYMDKTILPVASNVDRAFELYAHYCEARFKAHGALDQTLKSEDFIHFPEDFLVRVAQDQFLVQMLADHRFEELVTPDPDSCEWVEKVLNAARTLP